MRSSNCFVILANVPDIVNFLCVLCHPCVRFGRKVTRAQLQLFCLVGRQSTDHK